MVSIVYFTNSLLLTDRVDKNVDLRKLERSLISLAYNVDQIAARVKNRAGVKNILHCIRPKRRTGSKDMVLLVVNTCKLESALNALRSTIDTAKRPDTSYKRKELIRIAQWQKSDVDSLISQIESVLNF